MDENRETNIPMGEETTKTTASFEPGNSFAEDFHEKPEPPKQNQSRKKWALAAAAAAVLVAAIAIIAVAGSMFLRNPKKVLLNALVNAAASRPETTLADEVFGYEDMVKAAMEQPYAYGMKLKLEDSNIPDLEPFFGASLSMDMMSDLLNKQSRVSLMLGYQDMELLGADVGVTPEKLYIALPNLSNYCMELDYQEGFADAFRASYLVELLGMTSDDVEMTIEMLTLLREAMNQEGTNQTGGLSDVVRRLYETVNIVSILEDGMEVERAGWGEYLLNGKTASCTGYDAVINHETLMKTLEACKDFIMKDEEAKMLAVNYLNQLRASNGETPLPRQEAEDELTRVLETMLTAVDEGVDSISMTGYVSRSGDLACLLIDTDITSNGEQAHLQEDIRFQGGSYLSENMEFTVTVTNDSGEFSAEFSQEGDTQGSLAAYDWQLAVYTDGQRAATLSMGTTFDKETLDVTFDAMLRDDSSMMSMDMSGEGAFTDIQKGKQYRLDLDSITLRAFTATIELSGQAYVEPAEQMTMPEGTALDVLTADDKTWGVVALEMYMYLAKLASQLGVSFY